MRGGDASAVRDLYNVTGAGVQHVYGHRAFDWLGKDCAASSEHAFRGQRRGIRDARASRSR